MKTKLILSKAQILQLYEMLIVDYPNEDRIVLTVTTDSGIGANIDAAVNYTPCHVDHRDITDYSLW